MSQQNIGVHSTMHLMHTQIKSCNYYMYTEYATEPMHRRITVLGLCVCVCVCVCVTSINTANSACTTYRLALHYDQMISVSRFLQNCIFQKLNAFCSSLAFWLVQSMRCAQVCCSLTSLLRGVVCSLWLVRLVKCTV